MLYLHVSNRTENLLVHLAEVLRLAEKKNIFAPEYLLIQSQGMERIISQTLADRFGCWCNFSFCMPLQFVHHCAERFGLEVLPDSYERKIMLWRIEEQLRDLPADHFNLIRNYLTGTAAGLKRFQLAQQLANIFDQYQLMRPEMLELWQQGKLVGKDSAEVWQMKLWQQLVAAVPDGRPRGRLLEELTGRLGGTEPVEHLVPERLSVFGLTIMPPLYLRFLKALSARCDVHLYVLSPCRHYWGDIAGRRRLLFSQPSPEQSGSTGTGAFPESHPLLVTLGSQGRDFQRMLFDDVHFELEFDSYHDPLKEAPPNLLRKLQSDLLEGRVEVDRSLWDASDDSLRVVSCHSRYREVGVLKEHILHWLHSDPELELRDIVVMSPDIQKYSSLIPAIFSDLQHSISDRSVRRRNAVFAAFCDLLELLSGRFGWNELFDLLKEPVISAKLMLEPADLALIREWIVKSGIRWGLNARQRTEFGMQEIDESTWESGLSRLLMGYAMDSTEEVEGVLPYTELEGSSAACLGGLCQFVEIISAARHDFSQNYSLAEWSRLLLGLAEKLFDRDAEYSKQVLELNEVLSQLAEEAGSFHTSEVGFEVITAWLEGLTRETRSSSGFLRGQLTFCSMLPMRSIPFKRVCLIGLNEGEFPGNDSYATFDLMGASHRPGDRSRRMDDRYQFLEALMSARESLYISYIGKSAKNNEPLPPSVVVSELLEVVGGAYGAKELVVEHPLQPFSTRYFTKDDPRLFSYDETYCKVARRMADEGDGDEQWWQGQRQYDGNRIELDELLTFYRNPQRWFVTNCLDIRLGKETAELPESENFELGGLEKFLLEEELLRAIVLEHDTELLVQRFQMEGRWPLGTVGDIDYQEKRVELTSFCHRIHQCDMGEQLAPQLFEIELADMHLSGSLKNLHEGGLLFYRYANFKGGTLLGGWLCHLLLARLRDSPPVTRIICRDRAVTFTRIPPAAPDLERLVALFQDGCRCPSPLLVEPAQAWVDQYVKKGSGMLDAAGRVLHDQLKKEYEPELALLLGANDPMVLMGDDFEQLCGSLLLPIVEAGQWTC